jgi:ELWxxDGT repeat protein
VLHAPQTTAPIQAPVNIGAILAVGDLVFFSASTPGEGQELWVTEGTEATTRFVKDLKPGVDGSFPVNFINVGGKLYFTANGGVAGTELWKSDGTALGTVKVADIPGFAANFAALSGSAVLTATNAGPGNGRPAVDYTFSVEVLRADGSLDTEQVTLARADTFDNDTLSLLFVDLQGAINDAFPDDDVEVSVSGDNRFALSAVDPDIVRIRVLGGEALGFGANQASPQQVALTGSAVTAPDAGAVSFTLDVEVIGGDVLSVEVDLTGGVTADNTTAAHLAADLNAILSGALLSNGFNSGAVTVSANAAGALVFTVGDVNIAVITVRAGTGNLAGLGLTDGQSSSRNVALTAAQPGPTNGQVPADLTLGVTVTLATGATQVLTITLSGEDTVGNGSLTELAGQLAEAINTALGLGAGVVAASASSSNILTVASADTRITSITIEGGQLLGFSAEQSSVRSGDRLFYRAAATAQGSELWVLNVNEADSLPDVPVSFDLLDGTGSSIPLNLVMVGNTLYFTAFNGTTRVLYRVDSGGTPAPVLGAFSNVDGLINAGGTLAFVALPNGLADRQVFTYDGTSFTQLTNVAPTDATDFSPTELTLFNGRIYFAARDHADGTYTAPFASFFGRELWSVALAGGPTAIAANLGVNSLGGDFAPQPVTLPPPFPPIVIGFNPGNVASSNPNQLEASGNRLFFSAQGANGQELYISTGAGATLVDLAPGTASSFPFNFISVQTEAGLRTYFTANNALWISDGTPGGTQQMSLGGATGVSQLTAVGDRLYFRAGNQLWVTGSNPANATPFTQIIPPKVPLQVRVVAGEGDNQVTDADLNARTVFTANTMIGAEAVSIDLTQAVRDALARGETRLTVRVENVSGNRDVILSLAGPARDGQTGLQVNPSTPGLVADLLAGDGTVIETGKAVIDLRAIESGRYYLRVYDPSGQANGDIPFKIEAIAPIQGYTHPVPDRDIIHGEDGDDLIVGSQGLDRLWGDSGRDDFIGELVELKDFDRAAGEQQTPSLPEERSTIPPEGPPVDAFIAIEDPGLRVAIAEALGLPITESYIAGQYVIHVTDASLRTDRSLSDSEVWSQRIRASDLAQIVNLDASGRGISNLAGLQFAINVQTLDLAANNIGNNQLQRLAPGTQSSGDARGFPRGMVDLENLLLDMNPLTDLGPLDPLLSLERLSIDGTQGGTFMAQVPELFWPVLGGGTRGLEFLSLDFVGARGFFNNGDGLRIAKVWIAEPGAYRFSLRNNAPGLIVIDETTVYDTFTGSAAPGPLTLGRGFHDILIFGDPSSDALLKLGAGPAHLISDGLLVNVS